MSRTQTRIVLSFQGYPLYLTALGGDQFKYDFIAIDEHAPDACALLSN